MKYKHPELFKQLAASTLSTPSLEEANLNRIKAAAVKSRRIPKLDFGLITKL